MDKLCVIQADRERAADQLVLSLTPKGQPVPDFVTEQADIIRRGEADYVHSVQALAAHRIASQAELVDLLESMPVDVEFANSELFRAAVNDWWDTDVAPTLAALSHTKGEGE